MPQTIGRRETRRAQLGNKSGERISGAGGRAGVSKRRDAPPLSLRGMIGPVG